MKWEEKQVAKEILHYLENMKFPTRKPAMDRSRFTVFKGGKKKIMELAKKGEEVVIEAFAMGKVHAYDKALPVDSKNNRKHPELFNLFKKWIRIHNPKFKWTSIQVNRNVETDWHRDRGNIGLSYCIALGDFQGGGIAIEDDNGKIKDYYNNNKWLLYDGRDRHQTIKIKSGFRYAIIFFQHY